MKRKNGYIELDEEKKLNLYHNIWFQIEEKQYMFKPCEEEQLFIELFYEQLARFLKIPTVHYDLAMYHNQKGVLTESYKQENQEEIDLDKILAYFYITVIANEKETFTNKYCVEHCNNLDDIWHALEWYYQDLPNKNTVILTLMTSILDSFILQLCCGNPDVNTSNLVILKKEFPVLAPNFDYGLCKNFDFEKSNYFLAPSTFSHYLDTARKEIQDFWNQASEEDKHYFVEKIYSLPEENILFQMLEKQIGIAVPSHIKNKIAENYRNNKQNLWEYIEKLQTRNK